MQQRVRGEGHISVLNLTGHRLQLAPLPPGRIAAKFAEIQFLFPLHDVVLHEHSHGLHHIVPRIDGVVAMAVIASSPQQRSDPCRGCIHRQEILALVGVFLIGMGGYPLNTHQNNQNDHCRYLPSAHSGTISFFILPQVNILPP